MIDYRGKTALVTGAASGIGLALAQALAARGATPILADIEADGLARAREGLGGGAVAIQCNLAAAGAPERLVAEAFAVHGRLDLICSNAGMGRGRRLAKETLDADVERLFAVNLFAALRIAQTYLQVLDASGQRGRLMMTGSENSLSVPAAVRKSRLGLYAASKHALLIMAEWMRVEFESAPIDLHVLLPGGVYTPMIARAIPDPAKAPPELGLIMPERCAEIALNGMDLGLFYVPTHAHLIEDMRPRYDEIAKATEALGLGKAPR
jgi:NAD(P)-dependent dehydrogenase (short-subunit alcohol dehydrogenase family)